jgi:subtilase family serine protease
MAFSFRSRVWAGLTAGVLAIATPVVVAATSAQATTASSSPREKVPTGLLAGALPGAKAFGTTAASTPEDVSFILKERNVSALESAVTGGLKRFSTVSQFASEYGQTSAVVSELTSYLASFGITTSVYAGNVDVSATGTAGQFDKALSVSQQNYHVPAQKGFDGQGVRAQTVHSATTGPELPSSIGQYVLAVLGLSNYSPYTTNLIHTNSSVKEQVSSASTGDQPTEYLPSDFAANYGVDPLYKKGANGTGETIGIVTLAAYDPGAAQYFWQNVANVPATGRTVSVDNIDGGPGAPSDASGTGETDIDVEQSGGVAPGANVIVYQAPNTDPGFVDAFFAAAAQNKADTLSSSWGESETVVDAAVAAGEETSAYEAAFDEAFLELADQGQSTFVSAGDAGAYDASEDLGSTNLSVDTPGDSPYVTSSGGTTTPWSSTLTSTDGSISVSVTVPRQRAWGWDYLWSPIAALTGSTEAAVAPSFVVGGGGGYSTVETEPSYQKLVTGTSDYHGVQYLTPTDYQSVVSGTNFVEPTDWSVNTNPPVVAGGGSGRVEPDLSADADPYSGYLLYEPSAVAAGNPALEAGWGGTSFVAPQFNGSTAVIDSYLGHRIGLWNPNLYAFAAGPDSPVTPLNQVGTGNDNIFYTGNPGQEFNPATGLGVPNLAKFAADLAS